MRRLTVPIEGAPYPVMVGRGLLTQLPKRVAALRPSAVAIIADRFLEKPAHALAQALAARHVRTTVVSIEATEAAKDYRRLYPLFGALIEAQLDRHSVIVALGGGVIGDLAGFVAATYMRGIRWVGVPSTLLAQVDSSVGGKTGVNHPLGKNLIGAFHQPCLVVADTELLKTLSPRDRLSGFGEMVKYGFAYDRRLLCTLLAQRKAVLALRSPLTETCIARSLAHKARVVAVDEFERSGRRRVLNLGHTVGHALEAICGYGKLRHGEAVLYGLRVALALSVVRGHLPQAEQTRWERELAALPLPPLPRLSVTKLWQSIMRDKKAHAGKVAFVLLEAVGRPVADAEVDVEHLKQALRLVGLKVVP